MGMAYLLKNDRKRKINNTKDKDLYIDCRFIFGSLAHAESIKIESRNRLTPQLLKLLIF